MQILKHNTWNGFFRCLKVVATSVWTKDVSVQTKNSRAFGRKIACDHLLFTGTIIAGVLMSFNFLGEVLFPQSWNADWDRTSWLPPFYYHLITELTVFWLSRSTCHFSSQALMLSSKVYRTPGAENAVAWVAIFFSSAKFSFFFINSLIFLLSVRKAHSTCCTSSLQQFCDGYETVSK